MPITHAVVKIPGQTLAAVADWNANHAISAGTILRSKTLIVAASDSNDTTNADYFCDGVADEVQINAAIVALPATGGCVMLMDGTFDIDTSILMNKDNLTLIGQGRSTKILTDDVIKMVDTSTNTTGQLIKNIYFYGVNTFNHYGIYLDSYKSMIINCWFESCRVGVYSLHNYNIVANCSFRTGYYGIESYSGSYYCTYADNTFDDIGYVGIQITGYFNVASGNAFYSSHIGIALSVRNGIAIGNVARNGYSVVSVGGDYCSVVGNTSEYCSYCVYASSCDATTITDNSAYKSPINSFYIYYCNSCTISNNTIYDERGTHGIRIKNSHKCSIMGNSMFKLDRYGICLDGGNHNIISGNNIHDCSEDTNNTYSGILLTGTSTYNVVSNNRVSADAANKHRYGIREAAAADDWNCVTGNICTDAVTANISLQGLNDEEAHNIAP